MDITSVETQMIKMASHIAPLVMEVRGSIPFTAPLEFTIISVFCKTRIDTSASMKLIVLKRRIRLSDIRFLRF